MNCRETISDYPNDNAYKPTAKLSWTGNPPNEFPLDIGTHWSLDYALDVGTDLHKFIVTLMLLPEGILTQIQSAAPVFRAYLILEDLLGEISDQEILFLRC